jgi:UDPglucose--hexose-1-phosphate uridylyltransferase
VDPTCPFCPGNEHQTPPELLRRPAGPDWVVRVFPNKYPALVPDLVQPTASNDPLFTRLPARGHYEVIVEGAEHRRALVPDRADVLAEVVIAAQERYRVFAEDPHLGFVTLFKNHGVGSGASLRHPHWQLVAGPIVPDSLRRMIDVASAYVRQHGVSVYADYLDREQAIGERIVGEQDRFVVLAPYAPQWAGETWIIPCEAHPSFAMLPVDRVARFAGVLRDTLDRLSCAFADPAVNVLIVSAPLRGTDTSDFRWHVRIQPRLTTPGGFELATDTAIVTIGPEQTAELLRSVP